MSDRNYNKYQGGRSTFYAFFRNRAFSLFSWRDRATYPLPNTLCKTI